MLKYIHTTIIICWAILSFGQESKLANEYFRSGEYEKAAVIYKKLYERQGSSPYYFERYVDALIATEDYKIAEEEIKRQIKLRPTHMQLYVTLGNLFERQFLPDKADEAYSNAIKNIPPDVNVINNLGSAFTRLAKYDMAIEAFLKGREMLNAEELFSYNLADLYKRKGDKPNMIKYYIIASTKNPQQLERYKMHFQRNLKSDEDLEELRKQLYEKIQANPDNIIFPELLEWVYIEKEDFDRALRQARSLDRKNNEDGLRVKNIGDIAFVAGDYDVAIKAYEYVTQNKSLNNSLYVSSKRALLQSKRKKVTNQYDYTFSDLDSLQVEYESFIDEFGVNSKTDGFGYGIC